MWECVCMCEWLCVRLCVSVRGACAISMVYACCKDLERDVVFHVNHSGQYSFLGSIEPKTCNIDLSQYYFLSLATDNLLWPHTFHVTPRNSQGRCFMWSSRLSRILWEFCFGAEFWMDFKFTFHQHTNRTPNIMDNIQTRWGFNLIGHGLNLIKYSWNMTENSRRQSNCECIRNWYVNFEWRLYSCVRLAHMTDQSGCNFAPTKCSTQLQWVPYPLQDLSSVKFLPFDAEWLP